MLAPLIAALAAAPAAPGAPPSFLNEVVPILTRQGCNQGACHGKMAGQNGFRLSLRGYAPEQDFRGIVREIGGRRLDPVHPERSLLLLKATAQTPHEGGKLFGPDSREYRTLLSWVKAGAPGPNAADPRAVRLDITPADSVLKPEQSVKLAAAATFSDGSTRDVTWLTKFDSNDAAVAAVTPPGEVTARRAGATAVRAMFQTEVAVSTLAVPSDKPVDEARFVGRSNAIDAAVFPKLRALGIEPSDDCTDAEFLRRASLDAAGALPTPERVRAFLADGRPDKRARLVEELLASPEWVDHWTLFLGDLLQNRRERDHDVRGVKGVRQFHDYLRSQVARNRAWDDLAREVLTATGPADAHPAVGYYVVTVGEHKEVEKSEAAESVAQAFLGARIGCARCHNHPLERTTQDDFYHFSAFFTRVKLDRKPANDGAPALRVAPKEPRDAGKPVRVRQPRTNEYLRARPLDRTAVSLPLGGDPRKALAEWVTDPKNPAFAGVMVNRVWKQFLGVGLVEPVDDLRLTNPPSNPALWDALVSGFVESRYDLKQLMRTILLSRTYQLSSATRPSNEGDGRFYSHYFARRLPAEVLLDAMSAATGVPEKFDGYPEGVRAQQVPDPGVSSYFLSLFGRSNRVTACACERGGDVTMPQLLHLQNGDRLLAKVAHADGALAELLAKQPDPERLADELFLRTLSRLPKEPEREAVRELLRTDPRNEVFRDLLWALLNSKDFAFNR